MKKGVAGRVIGIVIIILCMGTAAYLYGKSQIDYLPFAEARGATDITVQIMGAPTKGSMHYDDDAHVLHFDLDDGKGTIMHIAYKGPKPEDLDTAMSKASKITAQGTFNKPSDTFVAENLLVKCPSKYQGQGETEHTYGKT